MMDEYGEMAGRYYEGNTRALREKPLPVLRNSRQYKMDRFDI